MPNASCGATRIGVLLLLVGVWGAMVGDAKVWAQEAPGIELTLEDGSRVVLKPWPHRTPLAQGSEIAIRLRHVMHNYSGHSAPAPWPRWLGVSATSDRIDAVDENLTSRNIFKVKMFMPSGEKYYDLPWFNMQASNGKYVVSDNKGAGELWASAEENNAMTFGRGWNPGEMNDFFHLAYRWAQRQARLNEVKRSGTYYNVCLAPHNVGLELDGVVQWLSGPAPNYGCYYSGSMDFFTVHRD